MLSVIHNETIDLTSNSENTDDSQINMDAEEDTIHREGMIPVDVDTSKTAEHYLIDVDNCQISTSSLIKPVEESQKRKLSDKESHEDEIDVKRTRNENIAENNDQLCDIEKQEHLLVKVAAQVVPNCDVDTENTSLETTIDIDNTDISSTKEVTQSSEIQENGVTESEYVKHIEVENVEVIIFHKKDIVRDEITDEHVQGDQDEKEIVDVDQKNIKEIHNNLESIQDNLKENEEGTIEDDIEKKDDTHIQNDPELIEEEENIEDELDREEEILNDEEKTINGELGKEEENVTLDDDDETVNNEECKCDSPKKDGEEEVINEDRNDQKESIVDDAVKEAELDEQILVQDEENSKERNLLLENEVLGGERGFVEITPDSESERVNDVKHIFRPAFSKLIERLQKIEKEVCCTKLIGLNLQNQFGNVKNVAQKVEIFFKKKERVKHFGTQTNLTPSIPSQTVGGKQTNPLPLPKDNEGVSARLPSSQAPRVPPPSLRNGQTVLSPTKNQIQQQIKAKIQDQTQGQNHVQNQVPAQNKVAQLKVSDVIDLTDEEDQTNRALVATTNVLKNNLAGNVVNGGNGYIAARNQSVQLLVPVSTTQSIFQQQQQIPARLHTTAHQLYQQPQQQAQQVVPRINFQPMHQQQHIRTTPNQPIRPPPLPPIPTDGNVILKSTVRPPILTYKNVPEGVCLQWDSPTPHRHMDLVSIYEVYSFAAVDVLNSQNNCWKRVGQVSALPLPMACTLTQVQESNVYFFCVRAVDKVQRYSPFSNIVKTR